MRDFSNQTFRYGGKKYTFQATLRSVDDEITVVLDNAAIRVFEYESELNNLMMRGSIEYVDSYGAVDRLLEKPGSYCEILFVENEQEFDGGITVETLSEINRFVGVFMVQNIGITSRDSNRIGYKIDLVSNNVYQCQSVIDFSNYGQDKQPVFDILRQCLVKAGFTPDEESFDKVQTGVKLNYITNGNDDIQSVVKYLFGKLYYYSDRDDSLKFMFWNETKNKPQLFDVKDQSTTTGSYNVVLSLLKSKHENMVEPEQNKIATITRIPMSECMRSVFDVQMVDYDYSANDFKTGTADSESITRYFGRTYDSQTAIFRKQYPMSKQTTGEYVRRGAYWSSDLNVYGDMTRLLTKNNAILIETSGEILRKPAAMVNIMIDRDTSEIPSEDHKQLDDMMTRYRGMEGIWLSSRVHHYVYPQEGRYRQWIALMRNYTVDMKNKQN